MSFHRCLLYHLALAIFLFLLPHTSPEPALTWTFLPRQSLHHLASLALSSNCNNDCPWSWQCRHERVPEKDEDHLDVCMVYLVRFSSYSLLIWHERLDGRALITSTILLDLILRLLFPKRDNTPGGEGDTTIQKGYAGKFMLHDFFSRFWHHGKLFSSRFTSSPFLRYPISCFLEIFQHIFSFSYSSLPW